MKRFLLLVITVPAILYGISFSQVVHAGSALQSISVTATSTTFLEPTNTPVPANIPSDITKARLEAFIRVPPGIVEKPYVILSGYQSYPAEPGNISLSGMVRDKSFYCASSPCSVEFSESGTIQFRAKNSKGDLSEEKQASILITKLTDGYSVTVLTLGQFVIFSDACATIWTINDETPPAWSYFPQDPGLLNTEKTLHNLAAKLITSGIVDTKNCPNGGWENNAPNACGLTSVKDQMTYWQNRYDYNIWLTGRNEHIPPVILKTLIEVESQFWPISQRLFLDELGLGQVNQLGIDVLLRTNPEIYRMVCSNSLFRCDQPYTGLSALERALIRGTLVQSLDATCPSCLYGMDLNKASQSISLIGKVLYANCVQTNEILMLNNADASYEDRWKFTLVSYHSGFGCLQNAIARSVQKLDEIDPQSLNILDWKMVSNNLDCSGSSFYVDKFWGSLASFNNNLAKPAYAAPVQPQNQSTGPTPTPFISQSRIVVKLFVDKNGDGIQQTGETLDNVQVNLELENGNSYTELSKNGLAIFDLQGVSIGVAGKVNLPGLYRSASVTVQPSGNTQIVFVFTKPVLPTRLP